jgi:hypothetical protein
MINAGVNRLLHHLMNAFVQRNEKTYPPKYHIGLIMSSGGGGASLGLYTEIKFCILSQKHRMKS